MGLDGQIIIYPLAELLVNGLTGKFAKLFKFLVILALT